MTYVGPYARLNADALESGDGGSVVLWSNTATGFKGNISARGGAADGNGGMAEVSSRGYLAFDGSADLRALHGAWGTLLLDPNNITISDGLDDNPVAPGGFDASGVFTPGDATSDSTINTATIVTQLDSSDVSIKTVDGNITVVNGFTYAGDNDRTLTLDAFGTLTFKSGATIESTGGTGGKAKVKPPEPAATPAPAPTAAPAPVAETAPAPGKSNGQAKQQAAAQPVAAPALP